MNQIRLFSNKQIVFLPWIPLVLGPALIFTPLLLTGKALFWGLPSLQFIPWQAFTVEVLKQGQLPLWNPYNGMGAPLLANYQLAFFYPPNWTAFLAGLVGGVSFMAWWESILVAGHLVWAGIGMALFVRTLEVGRFGQTVAGLAFSLGGYLVARSSFFTIVWAGSWLPWLFYCGSQLAQDKYQTKIKYAVLSGLCCAMQLLAGHAQVTWYSLLFSSLWVVFFSWNRHGWRKSFPIWLTWGASLLTGICLAAIQLLPTLEYLSESQRSNAVAFDTGLTYSYWPWRLLTLFAPDFFGNPGTGNYIGYASYWEDAGYIGIFSLLLAASTLPGLVRRKLEDITRLSSISRPVLIFFWVAVIIGFILALGKNTPVFPFLYRFIPTFALFNGPSRWMIWVVFSLCVLAGIGADHLQAAKYKQKKRLRLMGAVFLAVTIGAAAAWVVLKDIQISFIQATAVAGFWAFLFTQFAMRVPEAGLSSKWRYLFIGALLGDLLISGFNLIPAVPASFYKSSLDPKTGSVGNEPGPRVFLMPNDEYYLKFSKFFRFEDFNPIESWDHLYFALLPNINILEKTASANNFDPFVPGRYASWITRLAGETDGQVREELLKLMGVGRLEVLAPDTSLGVDFQYLAGKPRFRLAGCSQVVETEQDAWSALISKLRRLTLDSTEPPEIVLEQKSTSLDCIHGAVNGVIEVLQETALHSTVQVTSDQAGWLFEADTFYPGWKAKLDGRDVDIIPADYLFRAVQIPEGNHLIEFYYDPVSFKIGAAITGITGLIMVIVIAFVKVRRRVQTKL